MPVMVGSVEPKEILIDSIADEYVDPPIVVNIGATDAESGAQVCGVSKRGFGYFFECSIAQVPKEPILNDVR